jgi:glutamate/aspartate transport system substrate-binding protein
MADHLTDQHESSVLSALIDTQLCLTIMETVMKKLLVTLSVGLLACTGANAEISGTLKKIKDKGEITIGYREASIPFSYLDAQQKPIGYSMDLCQKVVDAVSNKLGMKNLKVVLQPVTSANRIPLVQNGTVDLECGSTTNTLDRQKQVAFSVATFEVNVKALVKKASNIKSIDDLAGKTVVTTQGTTSIKLMRDHEKGKSIDFRENYAKDHDESFLLLEADRASAFVMDDILLAALQARSKTPSDYVMLPEIFRTEPYGVMMRKDDSDFKTLVDATLSGLMKSGEIEKIYTKWFSSPIPPKNINLNFPMSNGLKALFKNPSDKGI